MRYQHAVYITRAGHWSFEERERVPISKDEWLTYLAGDPEFLPVTTTTAWTATGGTFELSLAGQGFWEWSAYSRHYLEQVLFQHIRGGIIVRKPDAEVLNKAQSVAAALGARVLSDEMP